MDDLNQGAAEFAIWRLRSNPSTVVTRSRGDAGLDTDGAGAAERVKRIRRKKSRLLCCGRALVALLDRVLHYMG